MAGKPKQAPKHVIKFRELREARGLTIRETARQLGVAESTVEFWDRGRQPSTHFLPDLAELFGLTIEELFGLPRPK